MGRAKPAVAARRDEEAEAAGPCCSNCRFFRSMHLSAAEAAKRADAGVDTRDMCIRFPKTERKHPHEVCGEHAPAPARPAEED